MKSLHNNKESIQQEDLTYVNIYAYNIGAPTYIKQILTYLKAEINSNTIIVGDLNTPFSRCIYNPVILIRKH